MEYPYKLKYIKCISMVQFQIMKRHFCQSPPEQERLNSERCFPGRCIKVYSSIYVISSATSSFITVRSANYICIDKFVRKSIK